MARFASTKTSLNEALDTIADKADYLQTRTVTALGSGSTATLTAAQNLNGIATTSGGSTITITTATAAQLVAAIPDCQVGHTFELIVVNGNSGTATLSGGSGVTLAGATTATTGTQRIWRGVVTNVATPAVTMYGI